MISLSTSAQEHILDAATRAQNVTIQALMRKGYVMTNHYSDDVVRMEEIVDRGLNTLFTFINPDGSFIRPITYACHVVDTATFYDKDGVRANGFWPARTRWTIDDIDKITEVTI